MYKQVSNHEFRGRVWGQPGPLVFKYLKSVRWKCEEPMAECRPGLLCLPDDDPWAPRTSLGETTCLTWTAKSSSREGRDEDKYGGKTGVSVSDRSSS